MGNYNIQNFYNDLENKGVRTSHQYRINMGNERLNKHVLYFQTASLPGKTIVKQSVKFFGFDFNVPVNLTYDNTWTVKVLCDTKMEIHKEFERWMDTISSLAHNTGGLKGRVANTNAEIELLDEKLSDTPVKTYRMMGIYPTAIGKIQHDHNSNSIATFDVTLSYQYWYDKDEKDPLQANGRG